MPDDIAIVGMGVAVPGALSPEEFWDLLCAGRSELGPPPRTRWDPEDFAGTGAREPCKTYQQNGGFLAASGPAAEDLAQGWIRHCLRQALAEVRTAKDDRFSLCLGYTADGSQHQEEALLRDELLARATDPGLRAQISARYGRVGPAENHRPDHIARAAIRGLLPDASRVHLIDTACASSLYAIDVGMRELLSGATDVAVCGGASAVTPTRMVLSSKNGGLSPSGVPHPLDARADGVVLSDGAALVVLKTHHRAVLDGDTILGVISGIGLSADGKSASIYKSASSGQSLAAERALHGSGLGPEDIGFVVAHATGHPAGDTIELAALRDRYSVPGRLLPVVANKSLVGHTGWASGAVSVIHLLLAMRHGKIPPQPGFRSRPFEVPGLTIPTGMLSWPSPRAGAVSAFGIGGANAHLLIREHEAHERPARIAQASPSELVVAGWTSRSGARVTPSTAELSLPAMALRRLDPAQIRLVQCVHGLPNGVRAALERHAPKTGVFVAHHGPTRSAELLRLRLHTDELARAVEGHETFLADLRRDLDELVPPPTEDSLFGSMPAILAARLSSRFDLRGLNMTVDGLDDAFAMASLYVQAGVVDLALVCAAEKDRALVFALTTREFAETERFDGVEVGRDHHDLLMRHVLTLAPHRLVRVRAGSAFAPPGTLVLTNNAAAVRADHVIEVTEALDERRMVGLKPAHVRVVADLSREGIMWLHDAMFLAARACPEVLSFAVLVAPGLRKRAPHPLSGLFTEFTKSLAAERSGCHVLTVVHDREPLEALPDLVAELSGSQVLPAVYYTGGQRLIVKATPSQAVPGALPLTTESVVVAAGGARGLGFELLKALAWNVKPHLVVLGSTKPKAGIQDHAYERLLHGAEVRENLAELAALSGPGRLTYHVCDLAEQPVVERVVRQIRRAHKVDLLLNMASICDSHDLTALSLEEFQRIRDFRPAVHSNLTRAFGRDRPRIWCNIGSGNDYMHASATTHLDEYTVGYTFDREHADEGVRHFLRELAQRERPSATVLMGPTDRRAIAKAAPAYLPWCEGSFFLDAVEQLDDDSLIAKRRFDLGRDGYLGQCLVRGYPTLPGAFYTAIAAEAARLLRPGLVAGAFSDLQMESFLHLHSPDRPHDVQITAQVTDAHTVHVRITGDVVAPGGRVLATGRLHAALDVHLYEQLPPAPIWLPWQRAELEPMYNPYPHGGATVCLSGLFAAITESARHPRGRHARFDLDPAEQARWFPRLPVPAVQLDALCQLAGFQPAGPADLVAPRRIGRIELFDAPSEGRLAFYEEQPHLLAVRPDGRVPFRITGLAGAVIGRLEGAPIDDDALAGDVRG